MKKIKRREGREREVYLNGFSPEDDKVLGTLGQETHEHLTQDSLKLVSLLDFNADTNGVDRTLNQHLLTLISADDNGVQQQFFVSPIIVKKMLEMEGGSVVSQQVLSI